MVKSGCEAELEKLVNRLGEVRYVNGNFNRYSFGVVFARWRGLGILTLAQVTPVGSAIGAGIGITRYTSR